MNRGLTTFLIATIVVLVAALAFLLGKASVTSTEADKDQPVTASSKDALSSGVSSTNSSLTAPSSPPSKPSDDKIVLPGSKPFKETFGDITLTFLPTKTFRKLVEYRVGSLTPEEDSSCTKPYVAREKVKTVKYEYGFVIETFDTWNDAEGLQDYRVDESELPRAFQGSVHDIVREGRTVTIEKQRCGMGQVQGLVAVRG